MERVREQLLSAEQAAALYQEQIEELQQKLRASEQQRIELLHSKREVVLALEGATNQLELAETELDVYQENERQLPLEQSPIRLREHLSVAEQRIAVLQEQLTQQFQEKRDVDRLVVEHEDTIRQMRARLVQTQERSVKLQQELIAATQTTQKMEAQVKLIQPLEEQASVLEMQLQEQTAALESFSRVNRQYESELSQMQSQIHNQSMDASVAQLELQQRDELLREQAVNMQQRIDTLEDLLQAERNARRACEERTADMDVEMAALLLNITQEREQRARLEEETKASMQPADVTVPSASTTDEIVQLKQQIDDMSRERVRMQQQAELDSHNTERKLTNLVRVSTDSDSQRTVLMTEVVALRKQLSDSAARFSQLESELDRHRTEAAVAAGQVVTLKQQNKEFVTEVETLKHHTAQYRHEAELAVKERDKLVSMVTAMQADLSVVPRPPRTPSPVKQAPRGAVRPLSPSATSTPPASPTTPARVSERSISVQAQSTRAGPIAPAVAAAAATLQQQSPLPGAVLDQGSTQRPKLVPSPPPPVTAPTTMMPSAVVDVPSIAVDEVPPTPRVASEPAGAAEPADPEAVQRGTIDKFVALTMHKPAAVRIWEIDGDQQNLIGDGQMELIENENANVHRRHYVCLTANSTQQYLPIHAHVSLTVADPAEPNTYVLIDPQTGSSYLIQFLVDDEHRALVVNHILTAIKVADIRSRSALKQTRDPTMLDTAQRDVMIAGATFTKYNYNNKSSSKRIMRYNEQAKTVEWSTGSRDKPRTLALRDIRWILYGAHTKRFKETPPKQPWCCLSISTNERTLDLVADKQEQAETWFLGLQAICHWRILLCGRVLDTYGRVLWKRLHAKTVAESKRRKVQWKDEIVANVKKASMLMTRRASDTPVPTEPQQPLFRRRQTLA
eukprot:TRINITY_DN2131_c0_g1_i1.p1 TRINITY_DN2131_c0_g1~~TRINITY_DN2131_c0_g1_i1.p1  ORF type:complete len:994 (+),score=273.73 TRINITY_DN2131_c0_g1_i1:264-2984(+)